MIGHARTAVAVTVILLAGITGCSASSEPGTVPTPVPDSGFSVVDDGFSFANYTNEDGFKNLDAGKMRTLFGDRVCARVDGDTCTLYPTARTWMKSANDAMNGGHCFGMAGLAWAMYRDAIKPQAYGAGKAGELRISGNPQLQRELAGMYATQFTQPTSDSKTVLGANGAIAELEQAWGRGSGYVLAFFKLVDGEQTAGHAITPVAVEDLADGKKAIVVYDNNFPSQPQKMIVDTAADTWTYATAANPDDKPDVYKGGTNNKLQLYPVEPMLTEQACPFCGGGDQQPETAPDPTDGSTSPAAAPSTAVGAEAGGGHNMVFLNQQAGHRGVFLTITGEDGQPVPGQQTMSPLMARNPRTVPEIELLPKDALFDIAIDGTELNKPANTDVTIVGPGYSYAATNIDMVPGAQDVITFDPKAHTLDYRTEARAAPDVVLELDHPDASYRFLFGGLKLPKGGSLKVALDPVKQTVTASSDGTGKATIDFQLDRISDTSTESGASDPIPLAGNESIVIDYGTWQGTGEPIPIGIDNNGDGTADEQLMRNNG